MISAPKKHERKAKGKSESYNNGPYADAGMVSLLS